MQTTTSQIIGGGDCVDRAHAAIHRAAITTLVLFAVGRLQLAALDGARLHRIGTDIALGANLAVSWARSLQAGSRTWAARAIQIADAGTTWARMAGLAHPHDAELWRALIHVGDACKQPPPNGKAAIAAREEIVSAMMRIAAYRAGIVIDRAVTSADGYAATWQPWQLARNPERPVTPWRAMAGHLHISGHIDEIGMLALIDACSDAFLAELAAWERGLS